jgi:hypothetical protein
MHAQFKGDFELGSHTVGRTHQDGALEALQVETEQGAKPSDAPQHIAVESLLRKVLDALLGAVATAYVNACVGVGHGFGLGFVRHDADFLRGEI